MDGAIRKPFKGKEVLGVNHRDNGEVDSRCENIWPVLMHMIVQIVFLYGS